MWTASPGDSHHSSRALIGPQRLVETLQSLGPWLRVDGLQQQQQETKTLEKHRKKRSSTEQKPCFCAWLTQSRGETRVPTPSDITSGGTQVP
ncbi:unnamed protein product [Boreogadus saida]